ncbi:MAG: hypothetical protein KUG83_07750 [Gammaproteobacteria bacterium]|nr:hypothetical protein [Gammaproteobacteria bacterium]
MSKPFTHQQATPPALLAALKKLLRPLVRLLIHFQISFPQFSELLKSLYVDVAERDFPVESAQQSDSRISLLTGIHRKDVRKFRNAPLDDSVPKNPAVGAKLVSTWLEVAPFCKQAGRPAPLFLKERMGQPSFDALVTLVSKQDLRPKAVLNEWLHSGIVTIDSDGKVCLAQDAYIPQKNIDEKCYFFARNIADHLSSSAHNLRNENDLFFDRHVFYNNLSQESQQKLERMTEEQGLELLKSLNRAARQLQIEDRQKENAIHRFNVGIFYYEESTKGDS